jgi:hypothetical protein
MRTKTRLTMLKRSKKSTMLNQKIRLVTKIGKTFVQSKNFLNSYLHWSLNTESKSQNLNFVSIRDILDD